MKSIQTLTPAGFAKYGQIIDFTAAKNDGWEIIIKSDDPGWRIALLEISRKTTATLEHHPESKESFEPISGVALLLAAPFESPDAIEIFLLDRPVCLNKKVWHQVISLSETSVMKITENLDVNCVYHELASEVRVGVV